MVNIDDVFVRQMFPDIYIIVNMTDRRKVCNSIVAISFLE